MATNHVEGPSSGGPIRFLEGLTLNSDALSGEVRLNYTGMN